MSFHGNTPHIHKHMASRQSKYIFTGVVCLYQYDRKQSANMKWDYSTYCHLVTRHVNPKHIKTRYSELSYSIYWRLHGGLDVTLRYLSIFSANAMCNIFYPNSHSILISFQRYITRAVQRLNTPIPWIMTYTFLPFLSPSKWLHVYYVFGVKRTLTLCKNALIVSGSYTVTTNINALSM